MADKTFKFCVKFQDVVITECKGAIGKIYVEPQERSYLNPNPWFEPEDGWFDVRWTKDAGPGDYMYVSIFAKSYTLNGQSYTAPDGPIVEYVAVFKWEDDVIYINPMSTVASIYTFSQRMRPWINSGYEYLYFCGTKDFCDVAYAMKGNLHHTSAETISTVIASSPNGMESNSLAAFNFLCNVLYYCLTDYDPQANSNPTLIAFTGFSGVLTCGGAMLNVALNPWNNVEDIYYLIGGKNQVYYPSLPDIGVAGYEPMPNQWTLAVKVNRSGSENFLIAGTAFTVFDKYNKAWVTNNFRQGSDKSGTHCLVFNANGTPADISPLTGGGILGAGFGVAVTPDGETISIGNFGWGTPDFNTAYGSVSEFDYEGKVLCPPGGYINGITRVQGMCYDTKGNLWMASWGTQDPMAAPTVKGNYNPKSNPSAIVCYIGGDHNNWLSYDNFNGAPSEYNGTFALAIEPSGDENVPDNVIVSNAGANDKHAKVGSALYRITMAADGKSLQCTAQWPNDSAVVDPMNPFDNYRQPAVDSKGNIYVGGVSSSRVTRLDNNLQNPTYFTTDNKVYGPWGITIDKKDTIFLCGFGQMNPQQPDLGPFGITVVDSNDTDWTNTHRMTLPTGGDPVRLANGEKLYGNWVVPLVDPHDGKTKYMPIDDSYDPLMRVTATSIDRAGNLWCANNWKPNLTVDAGQEAATYNSGGNNPGGDGIVIFLGVAEPIDSVGV